MNYHTYVPWDKDPNIPVCGECGKDPGNACHSLNVDAATLDARYAPYREAIFTWALFNGGIHSTYGGTEFASTVNVLLHLNLCSLDLDRCVAPRTTTVYQFADTDAGNTPVSVSQAKLTCSCGLIEDAEWSLDRERSMAEMVYQVVQAGDKYQTLVPPPVERTAAQDNALQGAFKRLCADSPAGVVGDMAERVLPALWDAMYKYRHTEYEDPSERYLTEVWTVACQYLGFTDPDVFKLLITTARNVRVQLPYTTRRALGWGP